MDEPEDEFPEPDGPPPVEYPAGVRYAGLLWVAVSVLLIAAMMFGFLVSAVKGEPDFTGVCLMPFLSAFLWDGWAAFRGRGRFQKGTAIASLLLGAVPCCIGLVLLVTTRDPIDLPSVFGYAAMVVVGLAFLLAGVLYSRGEGRLAAWHDDQARHREP